MTTTFLIKSLEGGRFDLSLSKIYKDELAPRRTRLIEAARQFLALYGDVEDTRIFSVPGRSEISGNHTDHNHGRIIAAAVSCDIIAVAAKTGDNKIRIKSENFDLDFVNLSNLQPETYPKNGSSSLIAGVAQGILNSGGKIGGYCAYTTSDISKGSGLSSSAGFEVMVGNIFNHLYNDGEFSPIEIAKISQFAENVYFGKPCGLMDQSACSIGDFIFMDFLNKENPICQKLDFDLEKLGYSLFILNTGGNHADLGEDYASVPGEMKSVAAFFGRPFLRGLRTSELISSIPDMKKNGICDRAILRALHFIGEDERVMVIKSAIERCDIAEFLKGIRSSADSSYKLLQNIYTNKNPLEQGISLSLAIANITLINNGYSPESFACRVHGGGFAGTIQIFAPNKAKEVLKERFESVFGKGSFNAFSVRAGAVEICTD